MLSTQGHTVVGEEQRGWTSINTGWKAGDAEEEASRPFRKVLTPGVSGEGG